MGTVTARRQPRRRRTASSSSKGTIWKQVLRALLTIAAVSLFSIYVLLPKTGDPVMAVCVGLFVLLGPAVLIKGSGEGAATRRARR